MSADPPWGWRVDIDTLERFEMVRHVDEDPTRLTLLFVLGEVCIETKGPFCQARAVEWALAQWRAKDRSPEWQQDLDKWRNDGSFTNIERAIKTGTEIRIKRSSGKWQTCKLTSCAGFGGLSCSVVWPDESAPDGQLFKSVDTKKIIDWNPDLRGGQ